MSRNSDTGSHAGRRAIVWRITHLSATAHALLWMVCAGLVYSLLNGLMRGLAQHIGPLQTLAKVYADATSLLAMSADDHPKAVAVLPAVESRGHVCARGPKALVRHLPLLCRCGAHHAGRDYCLTRAFSATDISASQPARLLDLALASALGWHIFSERLEPSTVMGGLIILSSTL